MEDMMECLEYFSVTFAKYEANVLNHLAQLRLSNGKNVTNFTIFIKKGNWKHCGLGRL